MYVVDVVEKIGQRRADEVAEAQGRKPKFIRDMRKALDDKSVDAVRVATPNHWHGLSGVWALQAGKDLYMEKPLCHEIAEGAALVAATRKNGRICQVGEQEKVSINKLRTALKGVKSLDDNIATLDRTIQHLTDNGIDLKTHSMTMSPVLRFDPKQELFPDSPEANAMLTRDYRDGFVCPAADRV